MRRGVTIGVAAVSTAMLAVGGYEAYSLVSAVSGGSKASGSPAPRTVVTRPPTAGQAAGTAKAFLDAWARGDLKAAGALTDSPDTATAALAAFRDRLRPSALTLTPGGPPDATASPSTASPGTSASPDTTASPAPAAPPGQVAVGFQATVEFAQATAAWQYQGRLGVVRMSDGTAAVHWTSAVIHPALGNGRSLTTAPVYAPPGTIVDRGGKPLDYPSLAPLLTAFKTTGGGGEPGTAVVIGDDTGQARASQPLFTITPPKPAPALRLTLDAGLQAAAEQAVQQQSGNGSHPASLVAVEPSTGAILAVANAPANGFNRAFSGAIAPGSTMKVITAAALLEAGLTPDSPVPCPATATVAGQTIKNDFPDAHPEYRLADDFAQSCNTAFVTKGLEALQPASLPDLAKDAFGLGLVWKTGIPNADAKVPVPANANAMAAELFGQGSTTMNSLAMASVAATVQNGTFRQPVLVPGLEQQKAARTLAPGTLAGLRAMMALTARSGTAAPAMSGLSGQIGAKTGSAEVDNQAKTNSWFTAYRGDLAVAAEVEGGGHGVDAAGPAVARVLRVGN